MAQKKFTINRDKLIILGVFVIVLVVILYTLNTLRKNNSSTGQQNSNQATVTPISPTPTPGFNKDYSSLYNKSTREFISPEKRSKKRFSVVIPRDWSITEYLEDKRSFNMLLTRNNDANYRLYISTFGEDGGECKFGIPEDKGGRILLRTVNTGFGVVKIGLHYIDGADKAMFVPCIKKAGSDSVYVPDLEIGRVFLSAPKDYSENTVDEFTSFLQAIKVL